MKPLDQILSASRESVRKSGMIAENIRMGVVSAVATDGTITVEAGESTFPRVRLLSGYSDPAVNDLVEIANTQGGWVCLGKLVSNSVPSIQTGTFSQAGGNNQWSENMTITYPVPFAAPPVVVAMPVSNGPAGSSPVFSWQATTVTATSFMFRNWRNTSGSITFNWIATSY